jgi:hypothetical protein
MGTEWLGQMRSTGELEKALGGFVYHIARGEDYPARQSGIPVRNYPKEFLTIHHWHPDVNQTEVVVLLPQQFLSQAAIDCDIHDEPFAGQDSGADLPDFGLIFHYQNALGPGTVHFNPFI